MMFRMEERSNEKINRSTGTTKEGNSANDQN